MGANPNISNSNPLYYATMKADHDLIRFLIENGADPFINDIHAYSSAIQYVNDNYDDEDKKAIFDLFYAAK